MTIDYTRPPMAAPPSPQPQRSWWSRNWGWVIALGCLLPVLLFGGCTVGVLAIAFKALRSTDVYNTALARARANPEVVARLGSPIEPKWWLAGSYDLQMDQGEADMVIPIRGPKGDAKIFVEAEKKVGKWTYTTLSVLTDAGEINLLVDDPSTEQSSGTAPPGG